MFVYWKLENAGSAQTIHRYGEAAKALGHEVVLYAPEDPTSRLNCSLEVEAADAVIFVLEWNIYLHEDKPLDLDGAMRRSRRERRVVIDNDGMYNQVTRVGVDYNHLDSDGSRRRRDLYDRIADKIYQPTLHPALPNVGTFLFHGYDSAAEAPLGGTKELGMVYVGSNWFRWRAVARVLEAIEPIRERLGRVALVGDDWAASPWWVEEPLREAAYHTDPAYLAKLDVEILPPVPIEAVIPTMSRASFNPVLVRPLFNHLRLVNPRMFETPAASTIPLFDLDEEHVREIYGDIAAELVLGEDATDRIRDVLDRPEYYATIAGRVRAHLAGAHSYTARMEQLVELVST